MSMLAIMVRLVNIVHRFCVVAISVHCARRLHRGNDLLIRQTGCVVVQSLWREGSMRTLGSGVRTTPCVRPLLLTVSRMDWSWLA